MQQVKYFQERHMSDVEEEINKFIQEHNVKIINTSIAINGSLCYALVTYEK